MRRWRLIVVGMVVWLWGCDVHEWPDVPKEAKVRLEMSFEVGMTYWECGYEDGAVSKPHKGADYRSVCTQGQMRYTVRAYHNENNQHSRHQSNHPREFVFTKDIATGYDHSVEISLPAGNYTLMAWADLRPSDKAPYLYNADDFDAIGYRHPYRGSTPYRDAFRGVVECLAVEPTIEASAVQVVGVKMLRPLAKYELITDDVDDFIAKEAARMADGQAEAAQGQHKGQEAQTRAIDLNDYRVVVYYQGYMYDTYSLPEDKPVDSALGMMFESTIAPLHDNSASLGSDYAFVGCEPTTATVCIGIYDSDGTQLSLTTPIKLPIRRNYHTRLRGSFLMSEATGGVVINPDFDGDHNITIL